MDYQSLLFDPIYSIQGVPVVLTVGSVDFDLTALDKTAGINVGENIEVPTIRPAAVVRVQELLEAGVVLQDLPDSEIEMNGFIWQVLNYRSKPSPNGENDGEVVLVLSERRAVEPSSDSESEVP